MNEAHSEPSVKVFDKLGVRFEYPENWELDTEELQEQHRTVSVYGPSDSFWSLQINPPEVDPGEMAEQALRVMREEYSDLEAEQVREEVGDHELIGYNMSFFCLDLTNTAQVRTFRDAEGSYLIFCQAEDRDYPLAGQVFAAITHTLVADRDSASANRE